MKLLLYKIIFQYKVIGNIDKHRVKIILDNKRYFIVVIVSILIFFICAQPFCFSILIYENLK